MKSKLLSYTAVVTIAGALTTTAFAETSQTPDVPAATEIAPKPTVEEELVYLRDIIALQTLRLDEAEQMIAKQGEIIEQQSARLNQMQTTMQASAATVAKLASAQPYIAGGQYRVKKNDTLYDIARTNNTTIAAIASANNLKSPYRLSIGQQLTLPGSALAPSAVQIAQTTENAAQEKVQSDAGQTSQQPTPQRVASNSAEDVSAAERPDVTQRAVDQQRNRDDKQPENGLPQEVGVRPEEEEERPYLAVFSDVGGILTPKGTMYVEPSVSFTTSSDNRFFFQGVEILDAILIGAIEATDSDRRSISESVSVKYGLTDRLEIDGRIAYVQRNDTITGVSIDDSTSVFRELSGSGIGDVDFGLHYQLNNGVNFPYMIANLRAKAPTGQGPFEVARDTNGIETELATGSGYWTLEPSMTFILPTAPAVIFANIGYQANMPTSPNVMTGPNTTIYGFDAGDAIRTSLGVGLSLNERLSVNFGYDQSHFLSTQTKFRQTLSDGSIFRTVAEQNSTTIGSFLFGGSYAVNNRLRFNLNTSFGATDESPDMSISFKAQYKLFE